MTHSNVQLVEKLVEVLDDERNDIFVHIDAKAPFDGKSLHCHKSDLHVLEARIDAAWGDYSLVEIELTLLKSALSFGPYAYYHLISGGDVPIKTQDYIHGFCDANQGKEFIAISEISDKDLNWRSKHHFWFRRSFRKESLIFRITRGLQVRLQDVFCKINPEIEFHKGSQWFSITNDFAKYLLQQESFIRDVFRKTFAPDEMVVQTLAMMSPFRDRIYDSRKSACGNMRYIRWKDREPESIRREWIEEMINSKHWLARKCLDLEAAIYIHNYLETNKFE